jgi:uncharacterized protein (TIGR03435 family)
MKSALFLLLALACVAASAQTTPANSSFEVASIHAVNSDGRQKSITDEPGTLTMHSVTLRDCLQWAYEVEPVQISGPPWIADSRFDINAKAADPADIRRLRLMLRTLLTERFEMKLRHEQKDLAVYFMMLAPGGPKFHEPGQKDQSKFLQSKSDGPTRLGGDRTGLIAEHVPLFDIAAELSQPLQRPVIDKTGLTGRYDIRIDIAAFMQTAGERDNHGPMDEMSVIFSAFPAQLGLKLEPGKDVVDFIVIDSADKTPTEN